MNAFGKMVEIIITAVLLFLVPLYFMTCKMECIRQCYVQNEVIYFVDCIRNTGFFTEQMYETFEQKLGITREHYEIELMIYEKKKGSGVENTFYMLRDNEELMEELRLGKKKVLLRQGDFVSIKVTSKASGIMETLVRAFTKRNMELSGTYVVYGGAVRDDIF